MTGINMPCSLIQLLFMLPGMTLINSFKEFPNAEFKYQYIFFHQVRKGDHFLIKICFFMQYHIHVVKLYWNTIVVLYMHCTCSGMFITRTYKHTHTHTHMKIDLTFIRKCYRSPCMNCMEFSGDGVSFRRNEKLSNLRNTFYANSDMW